MELSWLGRLSDDGPSRGTGARACICAPFPAYSTQCSYFEGLKVQQLALEKRLPVQAQPGESTEPSLFAGTVSRWLPLLGYRVQLA